MKRLLWLVPLLVGVLLGAGEPGKPKKGTPTPTPTPELDGIEEPEPTPTPEPPRFVASLESIQGDGGDRLAVFADGALVKTTRWKNRTVTTRLALAREELALIRRVVAEALTTSDEATPKGEVLTDASRRRMRMEIAAPEEGAPPRVFLFDDGTALPLAAGRARGALEDLRARFDSKTPLGDPGWDPGDVGPGDRLRRKSDGRWFVVRRDDTFERNLELRTVEGDLVVWVARDQIPKVFYDPALPSPDPAPAERPE